MRIFTYIIMICLLSLPGLSANSFAQADDEAVKFIPSVTGTIPPHNATGISLNAALSIEVVDIDASAEAPAMATFYGREAGAGEDFTIIALPDTQYYSNSATNFQQFIDQTQWVLDQKDARNIVLVDHLGDIVNDNDTTQWARASIALLNLNQNDIAIGIYPGGCIAREIELGGDINKIHTSR